MDDIHQTDGEARLLLLGGRVQGVGFRPFVYRCAHELGLSGWVRNLRGQVEILAQGESGQLDHFQSAMLNGAPPLAKPGLLSCRTVPLVVLENFDILDSLADFTAAVSVPPDYFVCDDCLAELRDPRDRRYAYPFINCTQCGPRYTLIRRLPYDRANTSMAEFALCPACQAEYDNPLDRRFHAEPVACPACGPQLDFSGDGMHCAGEPALAACLDVLRAGKIVAVKGVGGYHLLCDARDDLAVARLRARKQRPHKPLAVMFPARGADRLDAVRSVAELDAIEAQGLCDPMRPIVWLSRRADAGLSGLLAPGLATVGAMLPYSPLHHLLLGAFAAPLVATSGNVSGEPVLTDKDAAERALSGVADAFLHHNREIVRPAEDAVLRRIAGKLRPVRLGRGGAPLELELPFRLAEPVLALGGHMKATVALGWENRVVVSPHIGDLDTLRGMAVFEQVAADLQALYGVVAKRLACDAHPGYGSTRWAQHQTLPVTKIWHHHAHASALAGEHAQVEQWLVFAWDGSGLGEDGSLWGGEALLGKPGDWRRVASQRPFCLPGGERAVHEPWRSAAGLCWETGLIWPDAPQDSGLLHEAWQRRLNCPRTTSAGRLFDGVAALLGGVQYASHDAQAPLWLESVADGQAGSIELPQAENDQNVLESDWSPLLPHMLDAKKSVAQRAGMLHASLAQAVVMQAIGLRQTHGVNAVGLCGGVFQNRLLTELAQRGLQQRGFDVYLSVQLPCNDGGLSFGQIMETGTIRNGR